MEGLILRLKKRHQDCVIEDAYSRGYLMWGYYDQMQIFRVNRWEQFEPASSYTQKEDEMSGVNKLPPYHEEYPLKLIKPSQKKNLDLGPNRDYRFDYDNWNLVANSKCNEVIGSEFISICMLHFTGSAFSVLLANSVEGNINAEEEFNSEIQNQIINVVKKIGIESDIFSELHCASYYTTGFSDMVLIFRTPHFDMVSDIIFGMRGCTIGPEKTLLVSTSYLMCGMLAKSELYIGDVCAMKKAAEWMRFSIRFLLKPSVSPELFYINLKDHLGKRNRSHILPELESLSNKDDSKVNRQLFSQMYGYSDVLLLPDIPINELITEYCDSDGFMNPNSTFYKQYISSTRTSLRRIPMHHSLSMLNSASLSLFQDTSSKVSSVVVACLSVLDEYKTLRRIALSQCGANGQEERPRILRGMRHALNLYRDLAQPEHAYDIRSMLDPVINSLSTNLKIACDNLDTIVNDKPSEIHYMAQWQQLIIDSINDIEDNLLLFRREFNELLLDLLRADRQFIEGRGMLHNAVGSATKLILSYSHMLQLASQCLHDKKQHTDDCTYAFIISCGGVDRTEAVHLFANNDPYMPDTRVLSNITEHVLLQIRLPEKTMFHIGAAIFFLMHELLHYVGFRDGEERVVWIEQSISSYIAYLISDGLYTISDTRLQQIRNLLSDIGDEASRITAINELIAHREEQRGAFFDYLISVIHSRVFDPHNKISGINTYSNRLNGILVENYLRMFTPRYFDNLDWNAKVSSELPFAIADRYYHDLRSDGYIIAEYLKSNKVPFATPYLAVQELTDIKSLSSHLQKLFDIMLDNCYVNQDISGQMIDENKVAHLPPIENAIDSIFDSYKEAFVDSSVYNFLNCETWEYLSIFLYENEVPSAEFLCTLSPHIVLRFGSVLSVCDSIIRDCLYEVDNCEFSRKLEDVLESQKTGIINKGLWINCNGNCDRQNRIQHVSDYINRIGDILIIYRDQYLRNKIAQPLENYLFMCIEEHNKQIQDDPRKLAIRMNIRELFHNGMQVSENESNQEDAWKVLLKYWMEMSTYQSGENKYE